MYSFLLPRNCTWVNPVVITWHSIPVSIYSKYWVNLTNICTNISTLIMILLSERRADLTWECVEEGFTSINNHNHNNNNIDNTNNNENNSVYISIAESNGTLKHLFIPSKTAALVPEFAVKNLSLGRTLWWWYLC